MAEDMLVRNLAERTIDSYTYHVDRFAKQFGKLPEDLGPVKSRQTTFSRTRTDDETFRPCDVDC